MSKNLEQRVEDVLAVALERDRPGFSIEHELTWERRMKGALAQVFFLGMAWAGISAWRAWTTSSGI